MNRVSASNFKNSFRQKEIALLFLSVLFLFPRSSLTGELAEIFASSPLEFFELSGRFLNQSREIARTIEAQRRAGLYWHGQRIEFSYQGQWYDAQRAKREAPSAPNLEMSGRLNRISSHLLSNETWVNGLVETLSIAVFLKTPANKLAPTEELVRILKNLQIEADSIFHKAGPSVLNPQQVKAFKATTESGIKYFLEIATDSNASASDFDETLARLNTLIAIQRMFKVHTKTWCEISFTR